MMKYWVAGALAASVCLASPATARTLADLDCVLANAPADLGDQIVQDYLVATGIQAGERVAIDDAIVALATQCATQLQMTESELPVYSFLTLARLGSSGARARLVTAGMDMEMFDRLLEVSWGEGALVPPEWSETVEPQVTSAIEALEGSEVTSESLLANYLVFYVTMVEQGSTISGQLVD